MSAYIQRMVESDKLPLIAISDMRFPYPSTGLGGGMELSACSMEQLLVC